MRNASSTAAAAVQSSSRISAAPASYSAAARICDVGAACLMRRKCRPPRGSPARRSPARPACRSTPRGCRPAPARVLVVRRRERQHLRRRPARPAGSPPARATSARRPSRPSGAARARRPDSARSACCAGGDRRPEVLHVVQVVRGRAEDRRRPARDPGNASANLSELATVATRTASCCASPATFRCSPVRIDRGIAGRRGLARAPGIRTRCARTRARPRRSPRSRAAGPRAGS